MGDFTSVSLTVSYGTPEHARRLFELLTDTLESPTEGWRAVYPEAAAAEASGAWLPPPKGEYGIEHVRLAVDDDGQDGDEVYVELSSYRTPNARFQASAIVVLARAVSQDCMIDASLCVPEDYTMGPDEPNPFWDEFETWASYPMGSFSGSTSHAVEESTAQQLESAAPIDPEALKRAALEFVSTIELTGGLDADDQPAVDPEWYDLGQAYVAVCRALGRQPLTTSGTTECALCDKLIWVRDSWSPHDEAICAECDTEITGREHPPSLDPRTDAEPGGSGRPLGESG